MNKRANTPQQKKEICDLLYDWWLKYPELRLGQLLAWSSKKDGLENSDLFYIEDYDLVPKERDNGL
jgi:hypothetical protein